MDPERSWQLGRISACCRHVFREPRPSVQDMLNNYGRDLQCAIRPQAIVIAKVPQFHAQVARSTRFDAKAVTNRCSSILLLSPISGMPPQGVDNRW